MALAFPYQIGPRGTTATKTGDDHVRDLIAQVLFTSPGERVNRLPFGSGLRALLFAPGNDTLSAALQHTVQASLQQWLGDLVQVDAVKIEVMDSTIQVTVQYLVRRNRQRQTTRFTREF